METSIVVTGLGHMHPEHRISNAFFETLGIDSSAAWVEERTGIKARYSVLPPELLVSLRYHDTTLHALRRAGKVPSLAAMTGEPWKMAQERSAVPATASPQLVLCGTSVPDFDIPAHASVIAEHLKLQATCFDVNSACSSFVTDLAVAASMLARPDLSRAAIFNVERYSMRLDYSDRRSAVLFGDGATCALLVTAVRGREPPGLRLIDTVLHSDPSGCGYVTIPVDGCFTQEGARVQKFAISRTCEAAQEILSRNALQVDQVRYFIGHQANLRMLQSAASKLGFTASQHLFNVDHYGNQGAAGAPAVLSQNWDLYEAGDYIVVAVVGSGLTWGAALLQKV